MEKVPLAEKASKERWKLDSGTDRQINRQAQRKMDMILERQAVEQVARQIDRQTDRQTDRHIGTSRTRSYFLTAFSYIGDVYSTSRLARIHFQSTSIDVRFFVLSTNRFVTKGTALGTQTHLSAVQTSSALGTKFTMAVRAGFKE